MQLSEPTSFLTRDNLCRIRGNSAGSSLVLYASIFSFSKPLFFSTLLRFVRQLFLLSKQFFLQTSPTMNTFAQFHCLYFISISSIAIFDFLSFFLFIFPNKLSTVLVSISISIFRFSSFLYKQFFYREVPPSSKKRLISARTILCIC